MSDFNDPNNMKPLDTQDSGQTQPQPAVPPTAVQPAAQAQPGMTVCGIVGVVFGAIGFALSFIPIINNIAFFFGLVGVVLAVIALVGTFRGKKRGKALSIVAAVLSVLAIVITLAMQSATSKALDEAFGGTSSSQSSTTDDSSDESSDSSQSDASGKGEQDMEGDLRYAHVKIVSAQRSANDYENQPTVLVTYEWTNNTDKNNSFSSVANPKVFQNGQSLDVAIYMDSPEGYDVNSYLAELQPGATGTVTLGYVLKDDSDVTVDVTDFISFDDTKVVHTFTL